MALYAAIKNSGRELLKTSNTDSLDFISDVEVRARKTLSADSYENFIRIVTRHPDLYPTVPATVRGQLGEAFIKNGLGFTGTYKKLYFLTKSET